MKQVSLREKKMALNNAVASVEMEEFIKIMFEKVQNN